MSEGTKRPLSVALISLVYVLSGLAGLIYHAKELFNPDDDDAWLVMAIRLAAVVGGAFAFRGANWARWLLVAWISYHVVLSIHHSITELLAHVAILLLTLVALFNKKANGYFRKS